MATVTGVEQSGRAPVKLTWLSPRKGRYWSSLSATETIVAAVAVRIDPLPSELGH
jgi:hypothetical protein